MTTKKMQIAAQLYSVREFTQTPEEIAKTLKKVREIGYDCVQISGFGPCDTSFLRDELDKNGLTVCVTHTPYDRIIGDTELVIREHKILNCPYIGLGWAPMFTEEAANKFLSEIMPAVRKIRDAGLKFVYHNHQLEFIRHKSGKRSMDILLEQTSPDEFGLLPDLYWLQFAGVDPVRFLKENAERIDVIHLKDMAISEKNDQHFAEIFEGNMNYEGIFACLHELGIGYAAVEQDDCYGKDPFDCLQKSRQNIRARMGL